MTETQQRIALELALRQVIDGKTKPVGSLGRLEELALTLGLVQRTTQPSVTRPTVVVFAGDHGITDEKVSPFPSEVTRQMVLNFAQGGAAVNALCGALDVALTVVDVGVRGAAFDHPRILDRKVREGTRNPAREPALTDDEVASAIEVGRSVVRDLVAGGTNVVGFGEMGIGNTSTAALLVASALGLPIAECVGRGTGLDDEGLVHKQRVLERVLAVRAPAVDGPALLAAFGGLEIAAIVGGMLECHARAITVLVDGFIATSAYAVAALVEPDVRSVAIFAHTSAERAHRRVLDALAARALLDLDMRLGEGTGAVLAVPLLRAACAFVRDMASFAEAGVSDRG